MSERDEAAVLHEKVREARGYVEHAKIAHAPCAAFAMFSGGNDSSVLLHLVQEQINAVCFIDTGTGIPQTLEHVRATCSDYGLRLIEQRSPDKTYEQFVMEYGFPGPAAHRMAYIWLKERALHQLRRDHQRFRGDRLLLLTGVRKAESARRMGHVQPVLRQKSFVWVSPILDFTDADMTKYREVHGIRRSEVSDNLHMSGECLCGAFAKPGELEQIEFFYPEVAARIRALEDRVAATGNPACRWGVRPPKKHHHEENLLPGMLCSSCSFAEGQLEGGGR